MSPSVVALIPARAGSKRVPHKNRRLLNGVPLVAYTIAAAKESGIFDEIVVSTNDPEIFDLATEMNVIGRARRPQYATDTSPDIEWVDDLLGRRVRKFDAFSILRPTSPFRSAETIRRAWEGFQTAGDTVDSLRAVTPVSQHPHKVWRYPLDDHLQYIPNRIEPFCMTPPGIPVPFHSSPTQTLPKAFAQTAGLEIAHVRTVTEQHSISGDRVMPFLMDFPENLDLNEERDFLFAEFLVERGLAVLPEVQ